MSGRLLVGLCLTALCAIASAGCDDPGVVDLGDAMATPDGGAGVDGGGGSFTDSAIASTELSIARVVPDHGPFTGGNRVVLRGSGFTFDSTVSFDGIEVQGADHRLIDSRRLEVVVPAGEVGPADVHVENPGAADGDPPITFDLPAGYNYDAIVVDPNRGSTAGGTFVTISGSGTAFETGDTVTFGRTRCADVTVVSPSRITCRTPASSAGFVDVTVASGGTDIIARDAFQYYDTSDPFGGGLGGGPIMGAINLTVINAASGDPVEGAFAIVGEDLMTPHQGLTDALGHITFSAPDLLGPVTIHVSKHCFERTSIVAFDATDVTIFLVPWMDPMCGMGSGMPPMGRGRNGSFIEGHLQWPADMREMSWDNVPEARAGWTRVAFVYTTVVEINIPNPDPTLGGGIQRVTETPLEPNGYPYRIFARPGGMAVYALAGLEETATGRFVPYVMGITRNVLVGPGETAFDTNIVMDIPLDHYVDVQVGVRPPAVRTGPDRYRLNAYMDLGGEGLIHRCVGCDPLVPDSGQDFDILRRRDADRPFRFVGEPALEGALADGRYRLIAGWYTTEFDQNPYTVVVQNGVTAVDETVVMPDFLGIPEADSPAYNAPLPADRILRWHAAAGPTPDLHVILMIGGDNNPAWRMFVPGNVTEAPIPDLSSIPGLEDISSGTLLWVIYAIKIPGYDFNTFSYAHLNDRYWSHYAYDYYLATL